MSESSDLGRQVGDAYVRAVRGKDVEAYVSLYADEVRVFNLWNRWSHEGAAAWREMAEEWFGSLGDEQVAVELDDVETIVSGDLAVVSAFLTFRGLSAEGAELRSMNNRLTWALGRTGDGWRIVHEHTSLPLGENTQPIFHRT